MMILNLILGIIGIFLAGMDIMKYRNTRDTKWIVMGILSGSFGLYMLIAAIGMIQC